MTASRASFTQRGHNESVVRGQPKGGLVRSLECISERGAHAGEGRDGSELSDSDSSGQARRANAVNASSPVRVAVDSSLDIFRLMHPMGRVTSQHSMTRARIKSPMCLQANAAQSGHNREVLLGIFATPSHAWGSSVQWGPVC